MKAKHLLLFLFVLGFAAIGRSQSTAPYNHLIITEWRFDNTPTNYYEFSNKGDKTVDLSEFEFGLITPWWGGRWIPETNSQGPQWKMLPKKMLAPGQSFVVAAAYTFGPLMWKLTDGDPLYPEVTTQPEMLKLADMLIHSPEDHSIAGLDSITPGYNVMGCYSGQNGTYLRHHFLNAVGEKDSMVIDQCGVIIDPTTNAPLNVTKDVAGVAGASGRCVLIRRNSVTTGITDFSSHDANLAAADVQFENNRGLGLDDSEWMPIPRLAAHYLEMTRAVFWTVGNSVSAVLDASTLTQKAGSKVQVELANGLITVPWGIRNNDSIMSQFVRKPGLAWHYNYSTIPEDSAYTTIRTGDILTLYVCGDQLTTKKFTLVAHDPTPDDNLVVSKSVINYLPKKTVYGDGPYFGHISNGVIGMDTISRLGFATRVDTLFKYLEKPPKASWKIVYSDGVAKPDLKNGDILRVTSENGKVKDYFLKFIKYMASGNANLSSITWPDMPASFKGDLSKANGWKGDTIPMFSPNNKSYTLNVPVEYNGIPALAFTKEDLNAKVEVTRAKNLIGSYAERTVTFKVTAESDTIINIYTVLLKKEKAPEDIQPWVAEPFISRFFFWDSWEGNEMEFCNPGTEPLDLSNYMVVTNTWGETNLADIFSNHSTDFNSRYTFYIPGRKWDNNEADFTLHPLMVQPDLATNAIVYSGDVFAMADVEHQEWLYGGDAWYHSQLDLDLSATRCPWTDENGNTVLVGGNNVAHAWSAGVTYLLKILNDSVKNGLKPASDVTDFKVIDVWGMSDFTDIKFNGVMEDGTIDPTASVTMGMIWNNERKPQIYKGNPVLGASIGTDFESCEWTFINEKVNQKNKVKDPLNNAFTGVGSHIMNDVTIYRSTVSSTIYIVSEGYSMEETIKGLKSGVTVSGFYANILKADPLQTLTVKSASGAVRTDADAVVDGDILNVLSSDSTNTSAYILNVTANGLSSNAVLTSTAYTVTVTGTTGTVGGFEQGALLKNVVSGVIVPAGATMTMVDQNDAYVTLSKLNYDSTYVNVIASDQVYFVVVAENGTTQITYQLMPNSNPGDAYVTSDVYSIDQFVSLIQFLPVGTTVSALLNNITPAPGATVAVFDKAGFQRTAGGGVYRDDKLVATSKDGTTTKAYYFSMLNKNVNEYMAYVVSDDYAIDQIKFIISGAKTNTVAEFFGKLYSSFGATLSILDKNGNASTSANLNQGDQLLVTAADGITTAIYSISEITKVNTTQNSFIKIYPNPTTDRVVIQGLSAGNRVRVFNATGITLRDVTVDQSTEYVSLAAQPAGIYIFVISSGEKFVNIQKIFKK